MNIEAAGGEPPPLAYYYDVNDDSFCTAQDVLVVINYLNARALPAGEGETLDFLPPSASAKTTSASLLPASLLDDGVLSASVQIPKSDHNRWFLLVAGGVIFKARSQKL